MHTERGPRGVISAGQAMVARMHNLSWPLLFLALSLISAELRAHDAEDSHRDLPAAMAGTPDEQAIVALLQRFARSYSALDLDAVHLLIAGDEEFSYFEGSYRNVGWQSFYEHLAPEFEVMQAPDYRIENVRPFAGDKLGFATFDWSMAVTILSEQFEGGRHPVTMHGLGTAVVSRGPDGWRIRHLATARARKAAAPKSADAR